MAGEIQKMERLEETKTRRERERKQQRRDKGRIKECTYKDK